MRLRTTTAMLSLALGLAWLVGCTDVPSNGPAPPEVNSESRFLNADANLTASLAFDLGPAVSGLAFGQATSHQTFPAGARIAAVSGEDSLRIAMTTDQRATFIILPKTTDFREVLRIVERRIFDPPAVNPGKLQVVYVGADATGAAGPAVDIVVTGADTTLSLNNSAFKFSSGYQNIPAGSYTIDVFVGGDSTASATTTVAVGNSRYTSVIVSDATGALSFVDMADE